MRIPSGVTDQVIYFVAVDSTDFTTRETGLTSFTVYRDRNGGGATAMTTPTVTEVDSSNMPGVYKLLLDEDMTIGSGNDSEEMIFHITQASMAPVSRTIELYRPKITAGNTLGVAADGDISGDVDGDVSGTVSTVTTLTGHTPQTGDSFARIGAAGASLSAVPYNAAWDAEIQSEVADALLVFLGTAGANLTDLGGMSTSMRSQVNNEVADVMKTDTNGEPSQGAPPLSASMQSKIAYLYTELVRNKVVIDTDSANQKQIFADDESTILYEKGLSNASNVTTIAEATTGA